MKKETVFTKDFTLMVIGQIISLFGNSILRFSLSLYVLDISGSATVFGSILAISMIPTIILSPIGGILADRINRRNIMVFLDFTTSILCVLFASISTQNNDVLMIGTVMVILAIIQSIYQPSVQSSIPVLVKEKHLLQANGIVVQVNALSSLLGPILGGLLYGFLGLEAIVMISASAFFLSALMELFIHIPFKKIAVKGTAVHMVISDLKAALKFIKVDNPVMFKILLTIAALNMFFSSLIIVGLPYMIKIKLGLSSQLYGLAEGGLAVGSILAGLGITYISKKFTFQQSYKFMIFAGLTLLPIAAVMLVPTNPIAAYIVIVVSTICCVALANIFSIFAQTYLQTQTPIEMLGKVSSFVSTIVMCSHPIGQSVYGVLFDAIPDKIYLIFLGVLVIEILLSLTTKRFLSQLDSDQQLNEKKELSMQEVS